MIWRNWARVSGLTTGSSVGSEGVTSGCGACSSKQLLQRLRSEWLQQKAIGGGEQISGDLTSADDVDACLAALAELPNEIDAAEPRHLGVHQDHFRHECARIKESDRLRTIAGGLNQMTMQSEDGGDHFAADQIVIDEQYVGSS